MSMDTNNTRKDRREERTFDRKASRKARAAADERLNRRATTKRQRAAIYALEA